jgi:hypothetical protein
MFKTVEPYNFTTGTSGIVRHTVSVRLEDVIMHPNCSMAVATSSYGQPLTHH